MNAGHNGAQAKERIGGQWEDFGFVYSGPAGYGYLDEGDFQLSGNSTQVPTPPSIPGYTLVAWYHSHPDAFNWDNGNGIDPNGTHFSDPDVQDSAQPPPNGFGVTGYVAEYNDSGPPTSDASVETSEETFEWYSTDGVVVAGSSNPVKYQETSKGQLTASSGC